MRIHSSAVLAFGLLWFSATVGANPDQDSALAKTFLKEGLKQINRKYPFADWEKELSKCRTALDKVRSVAAASGPGFDRNLYLKVVGLEKDIQGIAKRRMEADTLMRDLHAAALMARIDGMYAQSGKHWSPEARLAFQNMLMRYEAGSLKPKSFFLANAAALDRDYRALQTDIIYAFAKDYLGHRVEDQLHSHGFARIEALYFDYSLQLDYWANGIKANAGQSLEQLTLLSRKFQADRDSIHRTLESLNEALGSDMLLSDLLGYAEAQRVEITLDVEEKIEASLKERNLATLAPIRDRMRKWQNLTSDLREKMSLARVQALQQKALAKARAENERKEKDRIDALRAEQGRIEEEQKARFKQTLSELRTFTFKGEAAVELDDESKQALKTRAGFLKTSYVRSGSTRLKVDKDKFSDTLAMVQKFQVEDQKVDFSKMGLQERSSQSAYTYTSPEGRTTEGDLAAFVAEVALGSFSGFYNFLSYVTPERWGAGRAFTWNAERDAGAAVQDREFSYVDLVVDAHRKRSGSAAKSPEATMNLPANMIIIFNPRGAILRFQPFADVGEISIQPGDLVGGKLYYKFLNYSTDREHIYLNGIDGEMKIGIPAGKS